MDFEIGDEATVGRSSSNQIVIDAVSVSNEHARIVRDKNRGGYVLTDLGSTNGTELDGERVTEERLERLHIISFGRSGGFIFVDCGDDGALQPDAVRPPGEETHKEPFEPAVDGETLYDEELPVLPQQLAGPIADELSPDRTEADSEVVPMPSRLAAPATESAAPDRTMAGDDVLGLPKALAGEPPPAVSQQEWIFDVQLADGSRLRLALPLGKATIGRSSECTVQLEEDGLSRRHALVSTSASSVRIRDLGSTNGTFVAGKRLEGDEEALLEAGARVRFGETLATLRRVVAE